MSQENVELVRRGFEGGVWIVALCILWLVRPPAAEWTRAGT
jgi:hypothetical protein